MNLSNFRKDFPIFKRKINDKPLVYLDSAATALKPQAVIDAVSDYYTKYTANAHRGIHTLSVEATMAYEQTRGLVQSFIGASRMEEIVFTSGATDAINLVVKSWGETNLKRGDEILVSELEHHSNFVPWQMLAEKKGIQLKLSPIANDGQLNLQELKKLLTKKTKLVAVAHASNVLGLINPIEEIIKAAHKVGAAVLIDAAQSIPHVPIDVQKLDCDFLVFSGHKLLAPTGIGVLYGKYSLLNKMPPHKFGGHMIEKVTAEKTTFALPPQKFEAGTMPIAQIIGLGAAIGYINTLGYKNIHAHEKKLVVYALSKFKKIPGLKILGSTNTKSRLAVFSFILDSTPAHDIASLLDQVGIEVRAGHHCAQILHEKFQENASVRASLYFYNTIEEIDTLLKELKRIVKIFK